MSGEQIEQQLYFAMIPHYNRGLKQISNNDLHEYKIELLRTLRLIHERLQEHKDKYQNSYKKYYDKGRRVIEFEPGDLVYIHFPNPENADLSYKISHRWRGPYSVVAKIDAVTYRVRSDGDKRISIFAVHVQRMKAYKPWRQ